MHDNSSPDILAGLKLRFVLLMFGKCGIEFVLKFFLYT